MRRKDQTRTLSPEGPDSDLTRVLVDPTNLDDLLKEERRLLKEFRAVLHCWIKKATSAGWHGNLRETDSKARTLVDSLQLIYDQIIPSQMRRLSNLGFRIRYDCFVSHPGHTKKEYSGTVHNSLSTNGYNVFYDKPELLAADMPNDEMWWAMTTSTCGVVVISEAFLQSEWCLRELFVMDARLRQWKNNAQRKKNDVVRSFRGYCPVIAPNEFWSSANNTNTSGKWIDIIKRSPLEGFEWPIFVRQIYPDEDYAPHIENQVLPAVKRLCGSGSYFRREVDCISVLEGYHEEYLDGTREDIIAELLKKTRVSRLVCLEADPGMGKSVIMAEIVRTGLQTLNEQAWGHFATRNFEQELGTVDPVRQVNITETARDQSVVLAAHFFRADQTPDKDWRAAIRSISQQLCELVPGFSEELEKGLPRWILDSRKKDLRFSNQELAAWSETLGYSEIFRDLVMKPITKMQSMPYQNALIVLDALDECTSYARAVNVITETWMVDCPPWVSLLVSQRRVSPATVTWETYTLDQNDACNVKDLKRYMDVQLHGNGWGFSQYTYDQIVDGIIERSEKNFLWLSFQKSSLQDLKQVGLNGATVVRKEQVENKVRSLPQGLDSTYRQFFGRLLASLNNDEEKYRRVLSIGIICPRSPIPEPIWCAALGYSISTFATRRTYDREVRQAASSLLLFKNEYVRPPHKDVSDWLCGNRKQSALQTAPRLAVIPESGDHRLLAETLEDIYDNVDKSTMWKDAKDPSVQSRVTSLSLCQRYAIANAVYHWTVHEMLRGVEVSSEIQRSVREASNAKNSVLSSKSWYVQFDRLYWGIADSVAAHGSLSALQNGIKFLKKVGGNDDDLGLISTLLKLAKRGLLADPRQLAGQVLGRIRELVDNSNETLTSQFMRDAADWLRQASSYVSVTVATTSILSGLVPINQGCVNLLKENFKGKEGNRFHPDQARFTEDGSRMMVVGLEQVQLLDINTDQIVNIPGIRTTRCCFVNENTCAFAHEGGIVCLRTLKTGDEIRSRHIHGHSIHGLDFANDILAFVCRSANYMPPFSLKVLLWDLETDLASEVDVTPPATYFWHKNLVAHLGWIVCEINTEKWVLQGGTYFAVHRLICKRYTVEKEGWLVIHEGGKEFQSVVARDGKTFYFSVGNEVFKQKVDVTQFLRAGLNISLTLGYHGKGIMAIALSGDETRLAVGFGDGSIIVKDVVNSSGTRRVTFDHVRSINWLEFSSKDLLASVADDGTVRLWEPTQLAELTSDPSSILNFAISPDGRFAIFAKAHRAEVWNMMEGTLVRELPQDHRIFAIDCSNEFAVIVSSLGTKLLSLSDKNDRKLTDIEGNVKCASISHDSSRVIIGCVGYSYRILNAETGDVDREFPEVEDGSPRSLESTSCAFAPDDANWILLLMKTKAEDCECLRACQHSLRKCPNPENCSFPRNTNCVSALYWNVAEVTPRRQFHCLRVEKWMAEVYSQKEKNLAIAAGRMYAAVGKHLLYLETEGEKRELVDNWDMVAFTTDGTKLLFGFRETIGREVVVFDISGAVPQRCLYDWSTIRTSQIMVRPLEFDGIGLYLDSESEWVYGVEPSRSVFGYKTKRIIHKHSYVKSKTSSHVQNLESPIRTADVVRHGPLMLPPGSNLETPVLTPFSTELGRPMPGGAAPVDELKAFFSDSTTWTRVPVRGDGSCLYRAVILSTSNLNDKLRDVENLRSTVADEISVMMLNRDGADLDDAGRAPELVSSGYSSTIEYLHAIRFGGKWGDHPELAALTRVLKRTIVVLQDNGAHLVFRDEDASSDDEPTLIYYNGRDHYDAVKRV